MKNAKTIHEWLMEQFDRASAGYAAQLAENGPEAEETRRAEQTCKVLEDVLRFVEGRPRY